MTRYMIEVQAESAVEAAVTVHALAEMIEAGVEHATGAGNDYDTIFLLETADFTYEHGDYRDKEGNLLHIADDVVRHVTWAKTAKQEDVEIDVSDWMEKHGAIEEAGV